jgi:hypothetical protein
MTRSFSEHFKVSFKNQLLHDFQQAVSKMRSQVKIETITAEKMYIDSLGGVVMRSADTRFTPILFDDILHSRRLLSKHDHYVALPIDEKDLENMEKDTGMQGEYSLAMAMSAARQVDKIAYDAAWATVTVGEIGGSTLTYTNDGVVQVDASAGLTYEKLLEVRKTLINNEVDVQSNPCVIYATGTEEESLMKETEFTSGDYVKQYAVERGGMTRAGMFDLAWFGANAVDPVLKNNAAGKRRCLVLSKNAIALGIKRDFEFYAEKRTDMLRTHQLVADLSMGAVRLQGKGVIELLTTP